MINGEIPIRLMYWIIYVLIRCQLICIFLLVPYIMASLHHSYSPSAICFLTQQPSAETVRFALQLAHSISSIDVFIIVDDYTAILPSMVSSTIRFLQFNETVCTKYGFQQASTFGAGKDCSAWDKALYYFSKLSTHHSFVWFIEDDVFIPSVQAFVSIHELYSASYDLISGNFQYNLNANTTTWYSWHLAFEKFLLPWAHGMVCAIGCSRRLLLAIDGYAHWRGHLAFVELLFHTLAVQDREMKNVALFELDTISFRNKFTFDEIQARPNNWWHPVKKFFQQRKWRQRLTNDSTIDEKNIFMTLNSIEKQLHDDDGTKSIAAVESQTLILLAQFEIGKGQMKPSTRRQLRDRFLRLATNRSNTLKATATLLADHAFKLPQPVVNVIIQTNKTTTHLKLEQAIENNKQTILELMKNNNRTSNEMATIRWLRDETRRLIRELTNVIQCEQQIDACYRRNLGFPINDISSQYSVVSLIYQLLVLNVAILCIIFIIFKSIRRRYRR